jgi:signal transduction histidine kinase
MNLRQRIILSLLAILTILVAPAAFGLGALRELQGIAQQLRARDAAAALTLGRLQAALGEVEHWQRIYVALALAPEEGRGARSRVETHLQRVDDELATLAQSGYRFAAADASDAWVRLRDAVRREQALVEAGDLDAAQSFREQTVNPAFAGMGSTLDGLAEAIDEAGLQQVQRAQSVAATGATTTLLAIAIALALALIIAGWLTRSILFPIRQLRGGMARVAEGDFEPDVRVDDERPDELGDLTRSFHRMTAQLAELDRLKAEFISVASHELKTPLSVIRGYVSLLQDGVYGPVPDNQQKILESLSDQTDRLGRLIQQLLDIHRFEAGGGRLELHDVPLESFLSDLVASFDVLAYQNEIDFKLEAEPTIPDRVQADPDRLNEVLGNLLSNAFKFTPRGGSILVRGWGENGTAVVEVIDTGVGIPEDMLPRIFEKFFQVENEAQPRSMGSGLGLAIAQEIVEAHGGTIAAESIEGQGTTFRLSLPVAPGVVDENG